MIRRTYKFGRPLTDAEVDLLKELITWRPGSRLIMDPSGAVVGCVAHPDDFAEFEKARRKLRRSGKKCTEDENSDRAKPDPPLRLFVSIGDFLSKGRRER